MAPERNDQDFDTEVIAETENYLAWKADEPDGESTFHLELNTSPYTFLLRNGKNSSSWRRSSWKNSIHIKGYGIQILWKRLPFRKPFPCI